MPHAAAGNDPVYVPGEEGRSLPGGQGRPVSEDAWHREMVARCLTGDGEAWARLVERFRAPVSAKARRVYVRICGAEPPASFVEDVFQDVTMRLARNDCKALRDFQWRCSLTTYLVTIAASCAVRAAGRERRLRLQWARSLDQEENENLHPVEDPRPMDRLISEEESGAIRKALETLPARDRLAIRMYYWAGATPTAIARTLQTSPTYACVVLGRAIEKLRKKLGGARKP